MSCFLSSNKFFPQAFSSQKIIPLFSQLANQKSNGHLCFLFYPLSIHVIHQILLALFPKDVLNLFLFISTVTVESLQLLPDSPNPLHRPRVSLYIFASIPPKRVYTTMIFKMYLFILLFFCSQTYWDRMILTWYINFLHRKFKELQRFNFLGIKDCFLKKHHFF